MSAKPTTSPRTNRGPSAAAENRRALIDAARHEFHEHGADVALSRIARRAGVGQGSLYRHFGGRAELAVAVFEQNLRELERAANAETPYAVLMAALERQAAEASVMVDIVAAAPEHAAALGAQLRALVAAVHVAGRRRGEIAEHATQEELMTACPMFARTVAQAPVADRTETAARIRRILDAWFLADPV